MFQNLIVFVFDSAGDYVKFGYPAAAAMTVLAWGGISYKDGYKSAGEYDNLLDAIKWGTDYFIKCHVSDNEFYGQVGFPQHISKKRLINLPLGIFQWCFLP